mmetsp:Transcript_116867/g.372060  ORF Transcript_116867/g.372060 Transcript_116867/m.372060 type:complete len:322 (-) Transcript_116867:295-1260(-)
MAGLQHRQDRAPLLERVRAGLPGLQLRECDLRGRGPHLRPGLLGALPELPLVVGSRPQLVVHQRLERLRLHACDGRLLQVAADLVLPRVGLHDPERGLEAATRGVAHRADDGLGLLDARGLSTRRQGVRGARDLPEPPQQRQGLVDFYVEAGPAPEPHGARADPFDLRCFGTLPPVRGHLLPRQRHLRGLDAEHDRQSAEVEQPGAFGRGDTAEGRHRVCAPFHARGLPEARRETYNALEGQGCNPRRSPLRALWRRGDKEQSPLALTSGRQAKPSRVLGRSLLEAPGGLRVRGGCTGRILQKCVRLKRYSLRCLADVLLQ